MSNLVDRAAAAQQLPRQGAIFAILGGLAIVVLDAAITNVALPTIAHSFEISAASSVLVVTAYQAALVMALLPSAALGDSLGQRRIFTIGMAVFTAGSLLCALSPSLPWLVSARFIQGLGAAAVMSLGVALLRQSIPPARLGTAIGWNALTVALTSAAGPAIGSFILSALPWPWLFALNLPAGFAVLAASRSLPAVAGNHRPLDVISMGLSAGGFGLLIIGAEFAPSRPLISALLFIAAAIASIGLVRRGLKQPTPLLPFDLLRLGSFRISVLASICCFCGQTAAMLALSFHLQNALQQSSLVTGLLITPWPLAVAVAAPFAGRLTNLVSGAWLCAAGGATMATGLIGVAFWPSHTNPLTLAPFIALCGAGFGFFQVSNNRNMFLSAPIERSAAAGGLQGTARLLGQTAGAMTLATLFILFPEHGAPLLALKIAAALTLAAGLISILRLPTRQP
ncbi:MFS transporter [Ferrovibrio sp.]|uniref:MFS transporter n=1 Tax=Ferrovibrio sp. TaxID=1917215 RepID=UPI001B4F95D0|nr:MFS transporter [Ferrovibrio sp.]MBP7066337.1 MFS transporter [Ferrovibrio sp.]